MVKGTTELEIPSLKFSTALIYPSGISRSLPRYPPLLLLPRALFLPLFSLSLSVSLPLVPMNMAPR